MNTVSARSPLGYPKSRFLQDVQLSHVVLVAIALRVIWSVIIPVIPLSDSVAYDTFAVNLWQHETYGWQANVPTSYWPVGTSAIYSLLYHIFGQAYWAIVILNIVLSAGIVLLTKRLCDQLFEPAVGALASLLVAANPTLIFFTTILASELLFIFFSLSGVYLFWKNRHAQPVQMLVAGLSFAAAYYVRPVVTVMIVIAAFSATVYLGHTVKSSMSKFCGIMAVLFICVFPWAARNHNLYGEWVPMSTNAGAVFWMGNQADTDGAYKNLPSYVDGLNEYERSQVLKAEALDYIQAEPLAFVSRTLHKLIQFHSYETIGVTWNSAGISQSLGNHWILPLKVLTQVYWVFLLFSALIGLYVCCRREGLLRLMLNPFVLFWASSAGLHALIVAQDRYHLSIVPFVTAFSAAGLLFVSFNAQREAKADLVPETSPSDC